MSRENPSEKIKIEADESVQGDKKDLGRVYWDLTDEEIREKAMKVKVEPPQNAWW